MLTILGLNKDCFLSSDILAKKMKMDHELLKRKMDFWVQKGVLKEVIEKKLGDKEVHLYFPDKDYVPTLTEENEQQLSDELPELVLLSQSASSFMQSNQLQYQISQAVMHVLKQTGPKTQERLVSLIKSVYKNEYMLTTTDTNIKEVLKHLSKSAQICFVGDLITLKSN